MAAAHDKSQAVNSQAAYHVTKLLFDNVEVIIPQREVVSIESIHELKAVGKDKNCIGEIDRKPVNVPVYSFSDEMEILPGVSEARSKCVVISHNEGDFSLLCRDIQNAVLSDMRLQEVPLCMHNREMPLTHLCLYKETDKYLKLGLVSNAECLNQYIKKTQIGS